MNRLQWVDAVLVLSKELDLALKSGDAEKLERVKARQAELNAIRERGLK